MQTLLLGAVLTVVALVSFGVSLWQNSRAERAGRIAADASLRALRTERDGGDSGADRATEREMLQAQGRRATLAYALKRASIVVFTIGLLGVVGGALVTFG